MDCIGAWTHWVMVLGRYLLLGCSEVEGVCCQSPRPFLVDYLVEERHRDLSYRCYGHVRASLQGTQNDP